LAFAEQVRVETGIDEPMIERLVRAFCDKQKSTICWLRSSLPPSPTGSRTCGPCPPLAAERFASHAGRIGESLELGIAAQKGVILEPGERYVRRGDEPSLETGPP
jgi:hypothetical protein